MRRFEFSDGKSNKFWEIALEANTYTVRYGRMGTDGQTATKVYDSPEKAAAEAEKVIKSKTKKGYAEVAAQAPAGKEGENADLEAAIYADRSDRKAWAVYADWLQSSGDPRGEYVAVDLALTERPDELALKGQRAKLVHAHEKAWFGDFRSGGDFEDLGEITWENGFWKSVKISADYDHDEVEFPKMLGVVLRHPSAKFLDSLSLGLADCEGENEYQTSLDSLVKHGIRRGLRVLHVGAFEYPDETEISWTELGSFAKVWSILPDLEELTLTGGGIELGEPRAPKLRKLKLETAGLPPEAVKQLSNASLPALERLEVWLGTEDRGGDCGEAEAAALLKNTAGLPKVKWLGLMNAEHQNDIVRALVHSPMLAQLEHLDLSMGTMTDEGAQVLLDDAAAFAHLKSLNLDDNFITEPMAAKLQATFPMVSINDQDDPDDWLFVSVGE